MFSGRLLYTPSIPVELQGDEDSVPDFEESFSDRNILGNLTNGCCNLVVIFTNSNFLKYYFYLYVPVYFHRTLELKGSILL